MLRSTMDMLVPHYFTYQESLKGLGVDFKCHLWSVPLHFMVWTCTTASGTCSPLFIDDESAD